MTDTPHNPDAASIRAMFARVVHHYDWLNTVMTLGQDFRWRRSIQSEADLQKGERLLDLATGTGQLAFDAVRRRPDASVTGLDLTPEMLDVARTRAGSTEPGSNPLTWLLGNATALPFANGTFDVVTHAYLMRYLQDLPAALNEQARVTRPGGRLVALETTPPSPTRFGRLTSTFLRVWIPAVGFIFARNTRDYRFLQQSTEAFRTPSDVCSAIESAGFRDVRSRPFMCNTLTVYSGRRSD